MTMMPGRRPQLRAGDRGQDGGGAGAESTAVDAGTRVDIVAEDGPDGISAEDHAAGLASSLTNLAACVEQ